MSLSRDALALTLIATLTACEQMPVMPDFSAIMDFFGGKKSVEPHAWQAHQNAMLALDTWTLDGRVAVQKAKQGWNAGLRWRQAREIFELRIVGPLGSGTYQMSGDENSVSLRTPQKETFSAHDVSELMRTHMGWELPVHGARYWVRGIPAPNTAIKSLRTDDNGRLSDLQQGGWRISVLRYKNTPHGYLPTKLFMTHNDVEVRMVIKKWQIGPS